MSHSDSEGQDPLCCYSLIGVSLVYDIIYTPEWTCLLERAKQDGCRVLNGWEMFDTQASLQSQAFCERINQIATQIS
jgi:shikimate 5-dehydrogenase